MNVDLAPLATPLKVGNLTRHHNPDLQVAAMRHHFQMQIDLAVPQSIGFYHLQLKGVPKVEGWVGFLTFLRNLGSGRAFSKHMQVQDSESSPQYSGVLADHCLFQKLRFVAAEHHRICFR